MLNKLQTFQTLSNKDKVRVLDYLTDLTEEDYLYLNPDKHLVKKIVNELIINSIQETNIEMQYEILSTLYKWSWYPTDGDMYNVLIANLENLLCSSSKALVLRILIASGELKYLNVFTKYKDSEIIGLKEIANEGIDFILKKKSRD